MNSVVSGPDAASFGAASGGLDLRTRETWEHDNRGNWLEHHREKHDNPTQSWYNVETDVRTYNDANQCVSWTKQSGNPPTPTTLSPRYDRRGNLRDDGEHFIYLYDVFNRLSKVYHRVPVQGQHKLFAQFGYDAFGRRTSARYDDNDNGNLDDDPAALYGYDAHWRVTTIARYEPAGYGGPSSEARTFIRERYVYHSGIDGETFSIGASSMQSPLMRLTDENGDGDYEDSNDRIDFFLTNRRGDMVAITSRGGSHVNMVATVPGKVQCKVLYSAYGVPRACHLLDMDRDGMVGGGLEYLDDLAALQEAENRVVALDPRWEVLSMVYCANEYPCINPPPMSNEEYLEDNYPEEPEDMLAHMSGSSGIPLYAGYWWDDRLKLFHVRHRVYDLRAGRFLQRDPIGYEGGSNLYMYAGNSPFKHIDPMGLDSWLIGSLFRSIGWDSLGDRLDDAVDGVAGGFILGWAANHWEDHTERERQRRQLDDVNFGTTGYDNIVDQVSMGVRSRQSDVAATAAVVSKTIDTTVRTAFPAADAIDAVAEGGTQFAEHPSIQTAGPFFLIIALQAAPGSAPHGNTAGKQTAHLYARHAKSDKFLKWGITQDVAKRYSKEELAGGYLRKVKSGPRDKMLKAERELVETQPGPLNYEPWAGCKKKQD